MEFELVSLADLNIEIIDGDRGKNYPKSTDMNSNGHTLFLNNKNVIDNFLDDSFGNYISEEKSNLLSKGKLQRHDLIVTTRGSVGNVGYFHEDIETENIRINSGMVIIRNNDSNLDNWFLYHLLKSPYMKQQYKELSTGSVQKQLPIRDMKFLKFILPPLPYQIKIRNLLNSIDKKHTINKNIIANLEELSQTLFKRWFIDFEFPDQEGLPYKTNGGAIVSDPHFKILPEGWNILSLDEIATFTNGLAMQKYRSEHDDYLPVVKIRELRNGFTDESSDKCIYDIPEKAKLFNGDIVFSWSATLMIKVWSGGRAGLNQHLFKVTSDKFPKWFYYFWTKYYIEFFTRIAKDKATTMGHINRKHLSQAKVSAPNNDIIQVAGKIFEPLFKEIENLNIQNNTLENLRDSLLPKLVSGELELPEELEV